MTDEELAREISLKALDARGHWTMRELEAATLAARAALARVRGERDAALREGIEIALGERVEVIPEGNAIDNAYNDAIEDVVVCLRAALSAPPTCGVKGCTLSATHGDEPHFVGTLRAPGDAAGGGLDGGCAGCSVCLESA